MADFSPAAQAVLDAFLKTPGEEPMPGWDYGRDLAAALRAAVDECDPNWLATTVFHHLYAIADELEEVKYGTYRCELDNTSQQS